jgi:hypothetical protein
MFTRLRNVTLVAGAAAALTVAGTAVGAADSSANAPTVAPVERAVPAALVSHAALAARKAPVNCFGGRQFSTQVRTDTTGHTVGESAAFTQIPGTFARFVVPAGQINTAIVTFTAEASLVGLPSTQQQYGDGVLVQIRIDNIPLPPTGDLYFAHAPLEAHSATVCRRYGLGIHTVTVWWRVRDAAPSNFLAGVINDSTLEVQVSD